MSPRLEFNDAERALLKLHGLDADSFERIAQFMSELFPGDELSKVTLDEAMEVLGQVLWGNWGNA